jgi:hypothetical protein
MLEVHEGQCGLCTHFGEHHIPDRQLLQIRNAGTPATPRST